MKKLTIISAALVAIVVSAVSAQAQVIGWGPATNMGTDSDVANNGSVFDAATFYSTATAVNGVTFNPLNVAAGGGGLTDASGDIAFVNYNGFPLLYATYAGGSTAYNNVVSTLIFSAGGPGALGTVDLANLTPTHTYQVEVWAFDGKGSDSGSVNTQLTGATAPDGLLNGTTSSSAPLIGQFVTGTFTATGATDSFNFVATQQFAVIDTVSIRDLTAAPEPSSVLLLLLGLLGLGVQLRRHRSVRA